MPKKKSVKKEMTIDDLAVIVARGFDSLSNEFNLKLDNKIDSLEEKLTSRIEGLERRIDDIALNRATKDEVYTLGLRVSKIEKKMGMK